MQTTVPAGGADVVNLQIALWAMGIFVTLVTTLGLYILTRMQKQGDDTNAKVTTLSEGMAGLTTASEATASEVSRLRERYDSQNGQIGKLSGARELARELVREVSDVFGTPQTRRRASDRIGDAEFDRP